MVFSWLRPCGDKVLSWCVHCLFTQLGMVMASGLLGVFLINSSMVMARSFSSSWLLLEKCCATVLSCTFMPPQGLAYILKAASFACDGIYQVRASAGYFHHSLMCDTSTGASDVARFFEGLAVSSVVLVAEWKSSLFVRCFLLSFVDVTC